MAVDLTVSPWHILARLAPPRTLEADLQLAADKYALTVDVYAAAADLWEWAANQIDTSPTEHVVNPPTDARIQEIDQDGIHVKYATGLVDYSQPQRIAAYNQYMKRSRELRLQSKPQSVKLYQDVDNPWAGQPIGDYDPEIFIPVE